MSPQFNTIEKGSFPISPRISNDKSHLPKVPLSQINFCNNEGTFDNDEHDFSPLIHEDLHKQLLAKKTFDNT